ncbi:(S)-benzoin forming benzil reductase [Virgibacillus sp. C22-A2]|uniref:(S)-benzoin forming benzil reductase n=1 Tax=Virgibacillus tibetensis TaxID=3042313 RepID=A0ABU6KEZ2_9BACI|nr:(S)-benzoin forming benzil reductase [Virgibacillus sp. C22-A2]
MKYAVVTGVSRGLGESVAKILLDQGTHVIGVSRSSSETLIKSAEKNNVTFQQYSCDLGDLKAIEDTFTNIINDLSSQDLSTLFLVNNAAVIDPVDQAMNIKSEDLAYHIQVNTIAPIVLMNMFLKKSTEKQVPFIGVTITSGAAERPVYGWSAYCSSKASINMYTKTVALEQAELNTGNKVIAFSPGIMDTDMQNKIRSSSPKEFADVDTFRKYKKNNLLKGTDDVGGILVDILTDETSLESGKIYNVKDYY